VSNRGVEDLKSPPFRIQTKNSDIMLPRVTGNGRVSPGGLSIQYGSMHNIKNTDSINQNSTSSLGERIDYKNMKVMSIKEFQQKKHDEDHSGKMKMHEYLHKDSLERLGTKNIID
jgi:hypothetical protein